MKFKEFRWELSEDINQTRRGKGRGGSIIMCQALLLEPKATLNCEQCVCFWGASSPVDKTDWSGRFNVRWQSKAVNLVGNGAKRGTLGEHFMARGAVENNCSNRRIYGINSIGHSHSWQGPICKAHHKCSTCHALWSPGTGNYKATPVSGHTAPVCSSVTVLKSTFKDQPPTRCLLSVHLKS